MRKCDLLHRKTKCFQVQYTYTVIESPLVRCTMLDDSFVCSMLCCLVCLLIACGCAYNVFFACDTLSDGQVLTNFVCLVLFGSFSFFYAIISFDYE